MKTTHWMLAALTLLVFTSLASPVMAQNDARELYLEAKKLLETRDYAAAAEGFEQVAEDYPDSRQAPEALYWQAFALMREGERRDLHAAKAALELQFDRYPDEARKGDSEELAIRIQARLAEMGDAKAAAEILRLANELGEDSEPGRDEETKMAALRVPRAGAVHGHPAGP